MWRITVFTIWGAAAAFAQSPCNQVTGITAVQHDGLTFVYGAEPYTGAASANIRYRLYRSSSQITSTAGATLVQDEKAMYNNGAIYYGLVNATSLNQTVRQSGTTPTLTLTNGGTALPPFTALGVSVNTATASNYYAITTVSTDGSCTESAITVGGNSLGSPVSESAAANVPVQQQHDTNACTGTSCSGWDGTTGLPLYLKFMGSGGSLPFSPDGCSGACGDRYAWFGGGSGAVSESYEPGMQSAFLAFQSRGRRSVLWGTDAIEFAAQDATPLPGGTISSESGWDGFWVDTTYTSGPAPNLFYPFTENRIFNSQLPWVQSHYGTDPHKIACEGSSAGTFELTGYAIRHPELCAVFFATPVVWDVSNRMPSLPNGIELGPNTGPALTSANHVAMDGTTPYQTYRNVNNVLSTQAATGRIPFVASAVGRQDTGNAQNDIPPGNTCYGWCMAYAAVQEMKALRMGFVFAWNNGNHGSPPTITTLQSQKTPLANNETYPAFTNFSLDANLGNGSTTDGDCNSGSPGATCWLNFGWSWSVGTDSGTTWSAAISNSQVSGSPATVDITPRNAQNFLPADGTVLAWSTSAGQNGTATVDASLHVATATGVSIPPGGTTITFTTGAPGGPSITTGSPLPVGIRGRPYSQTLGATGGQTPYRWDIAAGSLCAGLSLSTGGVIAGTPTSTGTCSFTARVTDAGGAAGTQAFTLPIMAAPAGRVDGRTSVGGNVVIR